MYHQLQMTQTAEWFWVPLLIGLLFLYYLNCLPSQISNKTSPVFTPSWLLCFPCQWKHRSRKKRMPTVLSTCSLPQFLLSVSKESKQLTCILDTTTFCQLMGIVPENFPHPYPLLIPFTFLISLAIPITMPQSFTFFSVKLYSLPYLLHPDSYF
jgi:hypothetical protein